MQITLNGSSLTYTNTPDTFSVPNDSIRFNGPMGAASGTLTGYPGSILIFPDGHGSMVYTPGSFPADVEISGPPGQYDVSIDYSGTHNGQFYGTAFDCVFSWPGASNVPPPGPSPQPCTM